MSDHTNSRNPPSSGDSNTSSCRQSDENVQGVSSDVPKDTSAWNKTVRGVRTTVFDHVTETLNITSCPAPYCSVKELLHGVSDMTGDIPLSTRRYLSEVEALVHDINFSFEEYPQRLGIVESVTKALTSASNKIKNASSNDVCKNRLLSFIKALDLCLYAKKTDAHNQMVNSALSSRKESSCQETHFVELFRRLADIAGLDVCAGMKKTSRFEKLGLKRLTSTPDLISYIPVAIDCLQKVLLLVEVKKDYPKMDEGDEEDDDNATGVAAASKPHTEREPEVKLAADHVKGQILGQMISFWDRSAIVNTMLALGVQGTTVQLFVLQREKIPGEYEFKTSKFYDFMKADERQTVLEVLAELGTYQQKFSF